MGGKFQSVKEMVRNTNGPLVHGMRSDRYQEFLQKHGINVTGVDPAEPNFIEKLKMKLALLNEYSEQTKVLLEFYKGTGARGLTMLDELVNLKAQILKREEVLTEKGIDPLEDEALQNAKNREFAIIKFLENLKYDKEKTEKMIDKKQNTDDIAFVMDVDPCNIPT